MPSDACFPEALYLVMSRVLQFTSLSTSDASTVLKTAQVACCDKYNNNYMCMYMYMHMHKSCIDLRKNIHVYNIYVHVHVHVHVHVDAFSCQVCLLQNRSCVCVFGTNLCPFVNGHIFLRIALCALTACNMPKCLLDVA